PHEATHEAWEPCAARALWGDANGHTKSSSFCCSEGTPRAPRAKSETNSKASDALARPVARDHPPTDVASGDSPEGARVRARVGCVAGELDHHRVPVHRGHALDELAGCVTRIGGQHDLPDPRPSMRVRPAFD